MKQSTKDEVQKAVNDIARGFGVLLKAIEKHGEDISDNDSQKLFEFLDRSMNVVEEKADRAREIASATKGTFSFDDEAPAPVSTKYKRPRRSAKDEQITRSAKEPQELAIEQQPMKLPSPRELAIEERRRLGGRLSANSPDINPGIATAPVGPSSGMDHVDSDISFMEE